MAGALLSRSLTMGNGPAEGEEVEEVEEVEKVDEVALGVAADGAPAAAVLGPPR